MNLVDNILDTARWAPSGDNVQPWCFERVDDRHFAVRTYPPRGHGSVYDLDGNVTHTSMGVLLETIEIAAAEQGQSVRFEQRPDAPETTPTFDVFLEADESVQASPLFPHIPNRSVQRRAMSAKSLTADEKQQLEEAVEPFGLRIKWLGTWRDKISVSRLLYRELSIRLKLPETYDLHNAALEWNSKYSETKMPVKSLGLDPLMLKFMKWTMKSRQRMEFFNKLPGSAVVPGLEIDWLPGLFCASHFFLIAEQPPTTAEDYNRVGRGLQRFWLTVTKLGLQKQPEMATVVLARYIRDGLHFTKADNVRSDAEKLSERLNRLAGDEDIRNVVWMGRVGKGKAAQSRSIRLPLEKLECPAKRARDEASRPA